jgi:cytochrome c oxidase cbb3-type subunit I/II
MDSSASRTTAPMETFRYNDAIVRWFALATLVWGIVATLAGLIVGLLLVLPKLSGELGAIGEYVRFGRLRPVHTNAAIFAFAGNAIFAAIYYSTQRLCKARMWSDALGWLHFVGWQSIIVAAAVTLPLGITQGKEYAELEWPIDLAIAVVWLGFFATNFFMTLARRRERHLYVSLWFYIATIVTVTILHLFNNLVVPIMGTTEVIKSYPIYAGVQDAFMQWWYGHNVMAFVLTIPFLGLMYYFLPKAAERPVFSYKLSIVHFWSLVFLYIWAGPHHLHYTALPEWASTLGMLFGVMLWMPSWGGMINGLFTLRGAWHKVAVDPVLKFYVVGITFYGLSTLEGSMLSIKSIHAFTHYTDWTIAHVHAGALGWNGFMTFGMLYWLLPRIFQTKLWSTKLANGHVWIGTIGILLYIVPIWIAGAIQGYMWQQVTDLGATANSFLEPIKSSQNLWWLRLAGGLLYVVGILMMAINYYMTWRTRPSTYADPEYSAPALTPFTPAPPVTGGMEGQPVHELGIALSRWLKFKWHRDWEGLPTKFTFLVIFAVVLASLFEIVPTFLIRSNVPTIASVKPYTPLELAGRDIYVAEGCYNCHSQMIRPFLHETKRYGEFSKPGEFVFDHPYQWGSRRIGPDLAREGGKQTYDWHLRHLINPESMTAESIMPSYVAMTEQEMNFKEVPPRVQAAAFLGAPYTQEDIDNSESIARVQAEEIAAELVMQGGPPQMQNRRVIALLAYLQRLGTDISKPAEQPLMPTPLQ